MVLYVFVAVLLILGTFDLKRSKLLYRIDMIVLFAFTAWAERMPIIIKSFITQYQ